ncbi:hypothetical protein JTB14_010143 [Gonioctena quinquepunctata]|nr:hypothetical protein JTB14_010143 [Gonioctena quinquepunctata]
MEQYKRHRKVLRTAFSKIGNELEQLLTEERTDLQDIQVHCLLLEDKYGSLQDINKNVFDSLLESDASEEELGAEMESCDGYMKRFKLLKYKYEQLRGTTGSINEERASIVSKPASNVSGITAFKAAKMVVQQAGGRKKIRQSRVIPFDYKSRGFLPLIPIFARLSALGTLVGGASAEAKTVIDAKNYKKKLEEVQRHNKAMEHLGYGLHCTTQI